MAQLPSKRLFELLASGKFIKTFAVRFGNGGFATQQLQKLFFVSIAFTKLVQRTNSLNMLFKTAVYVSLMFLNPVRLPFHGASVPIMFTWALACAVR